MSLTRRPTAPLFRSTCLAAAISCSLRAAWFFGLILRIVFGPPIESVIDRRSNKVVLFESNSKNRVPMEEKW
jgi:hypothetical protein